MQPGFSSLRLAWLQSLGGVFALACIRGGGEYGEDAWHKAGARLNKRTSFNDFAAVAKVGPLNPPWEPAADPLLHRARTSPSSLPAPRPPSGARHARRDDRLAAGHHGRLERCVRTQTTLLRPHGWERSPTSPPFTTSL